MRGAVTAMGQRLLQQLWSLEAIADASFERGVIHPSLLGSARGAARGKINENTYVAKQGNFFGVCK